MSFKDPYGSTPPVIVIEPTRPGGLLELLLDRERHNGREPKSTRRRPRAARASVSGSATRQRGDSRTSFRALFTVVVYRGF